MSEPAAIACTAASATDIEVVIAGCDRSSAIATPPKRISPRRRSVDTALDRVAGVTKSSVAYEAFEITMAGTPARIAAANGTRSRLRSCASESPTDASPSSGDWVAAPRPGKCDAALIIPARLYAATTAVANAAVDAGRSE